MTLSLGPQGNGDDITVPRNIFIALLRACGGVVVLDENDLSVDNRDASIEFVTYQDPRRYKIELQEPE